MPDKALWFFRDAQRALVPDGAKLHLSGQMTVEAWIKPDESVAGRKASYVLSKWATGSGFWVRMAGGRQPLELQFGIGDQSFNAPYTPPMDQWTHVALVCDGNEARLLVNGKIVAKPALAAALKANDATFCIGWSVSHEGANWRGMIDEVRLWSAARTPEQIQETMRRRLEGNEPGLVGYWDDEPWRWSPMADLTGNGNDAEFGGSRRSPGKTHPAWAPGAFAEPDAEQKFWENLRKMSQQYGPTSSVDTGKGAPRKPDAPPR
jgi:hypothetical protein